MQSAPAGEPQSLDHLRRDYCSTRRAKMGTARLGDGAGTMVMDAAGKNTSPVQPRLPCFRDFRFNTAQSRYNEKPYYLPKEGAGVPAERGGNIGYSILGSCPVSEFRNATISFSSLSLSLVPSWILAITPTACLRLQT